MAAFPTPLLATGYGLAAVPAAGLAAAGHGGWALMTLWFGGAAAVLAITALTAVAPRLARAFPRRPGPPDSLIEPPDRGGYGTPPATVAIGLRQKPYGPQG